jgi:hypothetical protein
VIVSSRRLRELALRRFVLLHQRECLHQLRADVGQVESLRSVGEIDCGVHCENRLDIRPISMTRPCCAAYELSVRTEKPEERAGTALSVETMAGLLSAVSTTDSLSKPQRSGVSDIVGRKNNPVLQAAFRTTSSKFRAGPVWTIRAAGVSGQRASSDSRILLSEAIIWYSYPLTSRRDRLDMSET